MAERDVWAEALDHARRRWWLELLWAERSRAEAERRVLAVMDADFRAALDEGYPLREVVAAWTGR